MRDLVVAHVPRDRAKRVLDLGCGTGSLVSRIGDALPAADVTGIDISPANIRAASAASGHPGAARIHFETADYLTYDGGTFDLIVADGVLHLIPGDTGTLVRKIAADLRPGGCFFCSMPFDCAYNRLFAVVRQWLRVVRSPITDRLILAAARLRHAGEMTESDLRERVAYMYLPPARMMSADLAAQFERAGLHRVADHPMPSTSPSQLKHSVTVWTRA